MKVELNHLIDLEHAEEEVGAFVVPEEEGIADYYELRRQMDEAKDDFQAVITHPSHILPFLQPGRLVKVKHGSLDFGWGVVVKYTKRAQEKVRKSKSDDYILSSFQGSRYKQQDEQTTAQSQYIVDVLLACAPSGKGETEMVPSVDWVQPANSSSNAVIQVVPVLLSLVNAISHLRIHLPKDLRPISGRETAWKAIREIQRRWPKSVPLLDPVENMGIKDTSFLNLVKV